MKNEELKTFALVSFAVASLIGADAPLSADSRRLIAKALVNAAVILFIFSLSFLPKNSMTMRNNYDKIQLPKETITIKNNDKAQFQAWYVSLRKPDGIFSAFRYILRCYRLLRKSFFTRISYSTCYNIFSCRFVQKTADGYALGAHK